MKHLILSSLMCCCISFPLTATAQTEPAVIKGKMAHYEGNDTLICYFPGDSDKYDTIQFQPNGSFRLEKKLVKAIDVLMFWKGKEAKQQQAINALIENGKTLTINLKTSHPAPDTTILKASFKGDLAHKGTFVNECYQQFSRRVDLTGEQLAQHASFKACRAYVDSRIDRLQKLLLKVKDETFVSEQQQRLEDNRINAYFAFANAKQGNKNMATDPDFMNYLNGINFNDTTMVLSISKYLDWYYTAHPDLYQPMSSEAAQLKYLKTLTNNKMVWDKVARNYMLTKLFYIQFGESPTTEAMGEFYEQYLSMSTDTTYLDFIHKMQKAIEINKPGKTAIDCAVFDNQGKEYSFKQLVSNGKITYVDFWATWCGPCKHEIPFFAQLAAEYKDNPKVQFISISIDENIEAWRKMIAADRPEWAQYNNLSYTDLG